MAKSDAANHIVDVPLSNRRIVSIYDTLVRWYFLIEPLEYRARRIGIKVAQVQAEESVLEVGVGAGFSFLEFVERVGRETTVHGVDLSVEMIRKSRRRVIWHGYTNFDLRVADIRQLPYGDATFDLVFSSYVLDLLPTGDLKHTVAELRRVLKPQGRLVLVNLSKRSSATSLYERLYRLSPALCGGCRPVFMKPLVQQAEFENVQRRFIPGVLSVEIITARKP